MEKAKSGLLLLLSLAFVGIGAWMAVSPRHAGDRATGAACAAFFAACAMVFVGQLIEKHRPEPEGDSVILVRPDRVQLALLCAASLLMGGASPAIGAIASRDGDTLTAWIGWVGGPFFAAAGLVFLWQLIRLRPVLKLDPHGLTSLAGKGWTLAWRDIRGISHYAFGRQRWLVLTPAPGIEPAPTPVRRLNAAFGAPPFLLSPQGTGLRLKALETIVTEYWVEYRGW